MNIAKKILLLILVITPFWISLLAQETKNQTADSIQFGMVVFSLNVDSALAIINNQFRDAITIQNGDSVQVKSGKTSIRLSVIHDNSFEKIFELEKDSIALIQHEFEFLELTKEVLDRNFAARKFFDSNLLIISDEGSDIYLNDELIGGEFVFTNAPTGRNLVRTENSSTYETIYIKNSSQPMVSDYSFRVVERFIKPLKSRAYKLAFIPGFSQAYKYQSTKSLLIVGGIAASFTTLSTFEIKYRIEKNKYDDLLNKYNNSVSGSEVTALGDQLSKKSDNLKSLALYRNVSLFSLIGIYTYNIIDGFISIPKIGYRNKKPFHFYLGSDTMSSLNVNLNIDLGE